MSDWNSSQYMKFAAQRTRPSFDLIGRLFDISPKRVLDLGCGPGNSTALLADRFKDADICGLDGSPQMLESARQNHPELRFEECLLPDGLSRIEGSYDLIFSNACIHWIPDQAGLISAVYQKLEKGGVFAVQIPLTDRALFYKLLNRLVSAEKWQKLSCIKNFHSLSSEGYYDALTALFEKIDMWETVYYHTVDSADGVLEWYKGSGLRPYLDALSAEQKEQFISDLKKEISQNFGIQKDGKIILKMPRLFFTATK